MIKMQYLCADKFSEFVLTGFARAAGGRWRKREIENCKRKKVVTKKCVIGDG